MDMDNPVFQNESGALGKSAKKQMTRSNSTLTPTFKVWNLTQAPRPKLCRCNSLNVPQTCCSQQVLGPTSLDYPIFRKKTPVKKTLSIKTVWSKNFWSTSFNHFHESKPNFHKFPSPKSDGVSSIFDPQFLPSKTIYNGAHNPNHLHQPDIRPKNEFWWLQAYFQKALIFSLSFIITLLILVTLVGKSSVSSSKVTWVDVILISGEFRITNEPFRTSLTNQSSSDFQVLSNVISRELDSLFSLSVLSEPYHSTAVTEFVEGNGGGVGIHCQLVLQATAQLTAIKVGLTFIAGLRNSHGHVWLGNFSVDIQSIGFQAGRDAVTWTDWSEWGPCQLTQEFGFVQLRSRNCTLRSGQYLHSPLPCLLVPHSHGNIETAACPLPTPQPLAMAGSVIVESIIKTPCWDCINRTSVETENVSVNSTINVLTSSTEQPIKNERLPCECADNEVCVALVDHITPQCLPVIDTTDPTGCGGHCKINTQLCKQMQTNAFRCVEDSKCLPDEWQCGNRLCIPLSKRCDGHFNCYDRTDEEECDCVGKDQFTCNDSQCIPNHRFCDGFADCKDHSDEPFGCSGDCKPHEWQCSNRRCIQQSTRCNGNDDCGDNSDETDCQTTTLE